MHLTGLAHAATATPDGRPHVSVVSPGVDGDIVCFLTRASSGKAANLRANPRIALMWQPAAEVYLHGDARVVDDVEEKRRIWSSGVLPYDPAGFFGTPDDPGVVLVTVHPATAIVLVEDAGSIRRRTWRR